MTKETGKSVALTTKTMEEAGIKTQINQNDIIDIVVSDQVEKMRARVDALTALGEKIHQKFMSVINGHKEKFLKELQAAGIASGDTTIDDIYSSSSGHNTLYTTRLIFAEDTHSRVEGMMVIQQGNGKGIPTSAFDLALSFRLTEKKEEPSPVKGVTFSHTSDSIWSKKMKVPEKIVAPIREALKAANEECQNFYSQFPNGRFNPNKIARDAKNTINKKILKNQAPGIAEQLNSIFDISL